MDRYIGEYRHAAHRKALDVFQRQIHIQSTGHHTDFETHSLVGDVDVTMKWLFIQALFEIEGHHPAADQCFAGI